MELQHPKAEQTIQLKSPLFGRVIPLDEVPDPVFSQKLMGGGVSIDPICQVLTAPVDGEVVQLHSSHHALTLRTDQGIEILMHIGIDTVHLHGQGFRPKVKTGDRVKQGDALIEFEADYIATHAKSLLTQIVIIEPKTGLTIKPTLTFKHSYDDLLMEISADLNAPASEEPAFDPQSAGVVHDRVQLANPTGIHARPAALIVQAAKDLQVDMRLRLNDREAKARSIVSLLALEAEVGDELEIIAIGRDAQKAVKEIKQILSQVVDQENEAPEPEPVPAPSTQPEPDDESANQLRGLPASPGVAFGHVFQFHLENLDVETMGGGYEAEAKALYAAFHQARDEIAQLQKDLEAKGDQQRASIFGAHLELLDDPLLITEAEAGLKQGFSAAYSWQKAYSAQAERLMQVNNELIKGRANDIRDVGHRVLTRLVGQATAKPEIPAGSVILADDLTPSDVSCFQPGQVAAFGTVAGGRTSHVAILARSLGIPAITGISERALSLPNGTPVTVDANAGILRLNPNQQEIAELTRQTQIQHDRDRQERNESHQPAITSDGHRIHIYANIGGVEDAKQAVKMGAEGVGLLRSEFLFMNTHQAPSSNEQCHLYQDIGETLGTDRPLVIRTLDIGGDKPLSYLPLPEETNPFLGIRGVRLGFAEGSDILRQQIRGILAASAQRPFKLMFPMVTFIDEFIQLKEIVRQEQENLGVAPIPIGIMVEVPAAALRAEQLAQLVDFFSIGTNDLTQYVLAMDRTHPKLGTQVDALDPSVLQLIDWTTRAAAKYQKPVSVCGGLASDPQGIPILLGLGIDNLSASIAGIPSIKASIRRYDLSHCRKLSADALKAPNAQTVRQSVQDYLDTIAGKGDLS
jgi:phosphocarrier protein FPr